MIFGHKDRPTSLNLSSDGATAIEAGLDVSSSAESQLNIEETVKKHFEEFREPVFRYLAMTFGGTPSQSEEITQEAFLRLFRAMRQGHSIENVRAWVYRVAHNLAVDQIKTNQFILPLDDEEWGSLQESIADKAANPEQAYLRTEQLERLRRAIGRLTLIERECLNLRTKGFRYREIAEILDVGTTTVSDTLHRVIDKLARETNG